MSGTSDVDVGSKNWPENRYTQKYRVEGTRILSIGRSIRLFQSFQESIQRQIIWHITGRAVTCRGQVFFFFPFPNVTYVHRYNVYIYDCSAREFILLEECSFPLGNSGIHVFRRARQVTSRWYRRSRNPTMLQRVIEQERVAVTAFPCYVRSRICWRSSRRLAVPLWRGWL